MDSETIWSPTGPRPGAHRPAPRQLNKATPPGDEGGTSGVQMQPIQVNTERVDKTVHHVVLDQAQLEALVLDAVAKAAGVVVDKRIVRVRQCYLSSRMGSIGSEYSATCTIEVDHQAAPEIEPAPKSVGF